MFIGMTKPRAAQVMFEALLAQAPTHYIQCAMLRAALPRSGMSVDTMPLEGRNVDHHRMPFSSLFRSFSPPPLPLPNMPARFCRCHREAQHIAVNRTTPMTHRERRRFLFRLWPSSPVRAARPSGRRPSTSPTEAVAGAISVSTWPRPTRTMRVEEEDESKAPIRLSVSNRKSKRTVGCAR